MEDDQRRWLSFPRACQKGACVQLSSWGVGRLDCEYHCKLSDSHAQQLQSTLGNAGQSDQLPVPHGHHRQQRLTYSTPSSGSLSASSGGSVASKKMNQAGRMMGHMNQSHMQQHTQQAQQQQGRCGTHGSHLMARVACLGGGFCCGLCAVTQGQKHDPACHAQC